MWNVLLVWFVCKFEYKGTQIYRLLQQSQKSSQTPNHAAPTNCGFSQKGKGDRAFGFFFSVWFENMSTVIKTQYIWCSRELFPFHRTAQMVAKTGFYVNSVHLSILKWRDLPCCFQTIRILKGHPVLEQLDRSKVTIWTAHLKMSCVLPHHLLINIGFNF